MRKSKVKIAEITRRASRSRQIQTCPDLQTGPQFFHAAEMTGDNKPSVCVLDMTGEKVIRSAEGPPPEITDISAVLGAHVRSTYALHTGTVLVDIAALQKWEYIRDVDDDTVEDLVQNILVRRCVQRQVSSHYATATNRVY